MGDQAINEVELNRVFIRVERCGGCRIKLESLVKYGSFFVLIVQISLVVMLMISIILVNSIAQNIKDLNDSKLSGASSLVKSVKFPSPGRQSPTKSALFVSLGGCYSNCTGELLFDSVDLPNWESLADCYRSSTKEDCDSIYVAEHVLKCFPDCGDVNSFTINVGIGEGLSLWKSCRCVE